MENQKDTKLNLLINQVIISFVIFIISIGIMIVGGDVFSHSKKCFDNLFDKPINYNQVISDKSFEKITTTKPVESYGMGGEYQDVDESFYEEYDQASSNINLPVDLNEMIYPLKGKVTSEYGWRIHPISGKKSFHTGVDIGGNVGTNIKAVLDGTIVKTVEDDYAYGNYLIISHGDKTETMYAHCSKLLVKKGQKIKKGSVVALVGSTGLSTGPHLHFEVRVDGCRLNPAWFLNL